MSLLIESIKLVDGKFFNLFYHERRMIRSLEMLCGVDDDFNLEEFLMGLSFPEKGLFKCRIEYDDMIKQVEFLPYVPRPVNTLRIVEHDRISYEFKYKDRKSIDRLFQLRKDCDDVLIVKRGLVTDTSYANIVFRKGKQWFTPWSPLLKGTQRQKLIDENMLVLEEIKVNDIRSFDTFKLVNAMLEFEGPEIAINNILA
ncbi:MAG TPA: aminotransferase class IV [Chryseosolibacter sp.]|nr:aminotransferase class IV [Chryseosolibacter sp.]